MLIISAFCWENFKQKALIISILLRLRMSAYVYAYALVKTSLYTQQKEIKLCYQFRPYQKRLNYLSQINIFDSEENTNVTLEHKNCIKYLGLLIDENLSWKNHIYTLTTKISKTVGIIAKLRHFVPNRTLLDIYKSLIAPYITYGLTSWGTASKTLLNKILVLQKRVLRLIHFAPVREHAIPLFLKAKLLPFEFQYYEKIANLMYDINTSSAPINISNLFSKVTSVHSYSTRSSTSEHFYTKKIFT